jgi:Domain of unknown function (DUF5615)
MIRLLLDENISPALVRLLADVGVYSQSVPHVGLAGRTDRVVWQYALDHDFAVVTTNALGLCAMGTRKDFRKGSGISRIVNWRTSVTTCQREQQMFGARVWNMAQGQWSQTDAQTQTPGIRSFHGSHRHLNS